MKKQLVIMLIGITAFICLSATISSGVTTVTGTFTPLPTGVSIACNETAPQFGNIALGGSGENLSINITNTGDVSCSVVTTAGDGAGTWTLVAGTTSPATTNQFCVNGDFDDVGYVDLQTQKTVSAELKPLGAGKYHVKLDLKVWVSDFTSEGTPGAQTLYTNLTASAVS